MPREHCSLLETGQGEAAATSNTPFERGNLLAVPRIRALLLVVGIYTVGCDVGTTGNNERGGRSGGAFL